MTTRLPSPAALADLIGQELGHSDWHELTQDQVNLFAEATGDHQWIHVDPVRAAAGPFGTTIAHGLPIPTLCTSRAGRGRGSGGESARR